MSGGRRAVFLVWRTGLVDGLDGWLLLIPPIVLFHVMYLKINVIYKMNPYMIRDDRGCDNAVCQNRIFISLVHPGS